MADRAGERKGFTLPDGAAAVTGAAVASVHLKLAVHEPAGLLEWSGVGALFAWLSLVSAGPFVFLVRRFGTRPPGYPRVGDRLWALAGVPWIVAALIRTGDAGSDSPAIRPDPAYVGALTIGLALMAMITVPVLAARFLVTDPGTRPPAGPTPWTNRLGLALAVAWPIQCAVGLIVMS